jgi:pilus assembly protein CpaF
MSFELILPFLRLIEEYILDPEISEVMVNATGLVVIETAGKLQTLTDVSLDKKHLEVAVKNIARRLGDDISEEKPLLDSRLPDGSRVAAVFSPCSIGGTTLVIRKFHNRWFSLRQLVENGSLPQSIAQALLQAISQRRNILISGGTGAGKTTLLNAVAMEFSAAERLVAIEDTAEIKLDKPNVVRLEPRGKRSDGADLTIRDLVKMSMRLRPDRIIVGEVRGGEAFDLLQALNTGHSGSVSTIHANSAMQALAKFANYILQSGVELPYAAIRASIAESVNLVVQVERRQDRRLVTEALVIEGFNHTDDKYEVTAIYRFDPALEPEFREQRKPPRRTRGGPRNAEWRNEDLAANES